jgi:phage baseplate assembly protein W
MANPIENLIAVWTDNVGVQLSWSAPSDISTSSLYQIYTLSGSAGAPLSTYYYKLYSSVGAMSVISKTGSGYTLDFPATSAIIDWFDMLNLGMSGNVPASLTIKIVHVDASDAVSDGVFATVYPPSQLSTIAIPHMQNGFNIDPVYGQMLVNSQNSSEEISASVEVLLGTTAGQRSLAPSYGIDDPEFTHVNPKIIQDAISTWEPRAQASVSVTYDNSNNAKVRVNIAPTSGESL